MQKKNKIQSRIEVTNWNSFKQIEKDKIKTLNALQDAKNIEKQQLNSGWKYVRINPKTIILKKKQS